MKVSLDGGALCTKGNRRFGNYTFTRSLLETIQRLNSHDEYFIYSFCPKPTWLKSRVNLHYQLLKPKLLWLSTRVSIEELRQKKSIFLALNQAIPLSTKSRVIAFSHGLSFYFYPKYYPDSYHALQDELNNMVQRAEVIVVASTRVKRELKKVYPTCKNIVTINFGVPTDMLERKSKVDSKYFLYVGMDHPIKNIDFLIRVFKQFRRKSRFANYKLYLVGNLDRFEDHENNIFTFPNISRKQLGGIYAKASAYLTASFYESFNFPVLEALSQNCPVIGFETAIIPEFSPYVRVEDNEEGFVKNMEEIAEGKKEYDYRDEVLKRFSWEKYFLKLKDLFTKD